MTTEPSDTDAARLRRAKIVCTLGPSTATVERVAALVRAGMDVARLNLSHGTHESHRQLCSHVRRAAAAAGRVVGILADLQGPRIRLGLFRDGGAELVTGSTFILSSKSVLGSSKLASTTYEALAHEVGSGDVIFANDGLVRLEVVDTDGDEVRCLVVEGGFVGDRKGLNLPRVDLSAPALTAKDVHDLRFALDIGVDLVAMSFVRRASDVDYARAVMDDVGRHVPVLAKLEKPQAVEALEDIVFAFDGLMVARGDLGIELPLQLVPLVQKRAIQIAREQAKPVIVATQMLESMTTAPRPTRAEVSDVANAVLDGADALMLSAETSVGRSPAKAARVMEQVILATEQDLIDHIPPLELAPTGSDDAIAAAAIALASSTKSAALVAFTESGATARRLAAHRPLLPLLIFTPHLSVQHRLTLTWGVASFVTTAVTTTDEMIDTVDRLIPEVGGVEQGKTVVVVAGIPPGTPGTTNSIRVQTVSSTRH